jgi:actin-related protein
MSYLLLDPKTFALVERMMREHCYVSKDGISQMRRDLEDGGVDIKNQWELPDGQVIDVQQARWCAVELLFQSPPTQHQLHPTKTGMEELMDVLKLDHDYTPLDWIEPDSPKTNPWIWRASATTSAKGTATIATTTSSSTSPLATLEETKVTVTCECKGDNLMEAIVECLNASSNEYHNDLLKNVIVTGGGSLLNGMHLRLSHELTARYPTHKIKVFL